MCLACQKSMREGKMKKFFVIFFMICCFGLTCFSGCSCSDLVATGLIYKLNDDGNTYSLTGLSAYPWEELDITIPSRFKGKPVTAIKYGALSGHDEIISIKIPDSVTTIGEGAFSSCENLEKVELPNSITQISARTFKNCIELTDVTIPSSVTRIEESAFAGCRKISNLTIPNSVTYIGLDALEDNIQNFHYTYDSGVSYYGPSNNPYMVAASGSGSNIEIREGCQVINSWFFWESRADLVTITFPNTLKEIGDGAFSYCINLSSISLPDSLEYLGESAFYRCEKVETIVIPDLIEELFESTFEECSALKSITLGSGLKSFYFDSFRYCDAIETVIFKNPDANWHFNRRMDLGRDPERNDSMTKITSGALSTPEGSTEIFKRYYNYEPIRNTYYTRLGMVVVEEVQ